MKKYVVAGAIFDGEKLSLDSIVVFESQETAKLYITENLDLFAEKYGKCINYWRPTISGCQEYSIWDEEMTVIAKYKVSEIEL